LLGNSAHPSQPLFRTAPISFIQISKLSTFYTTQMLSTCSKLLSLTFRPTITQSPHNFSQKSHPYPLLLRSTYNLLLNQIRASHHPTYTHTKDPQVLHTKRPTTHTAARPYHAHYSYPWANPTTQSNPQLTPTHHSAAPPKTLPQRTQKHIVVPPPHLPHVEPRPKVQKTSNPNSPQNILFVNQREIVKFPQNKELHLVTLFPVVLREHPFSEFAPSKSSTKNLFNSPSVDPILSLFSSSLIRGPHADLILFVRRFTVTHFLIYFFIQESF
jgi:hypothetical protein